MGLELDWYQARALLEWQVELGVTDALLAQPVDRFALAEQPVMPQKPRGEAAVTPTPALAADPAALARAAGDEARRLASAAMTLDDLAQALADFDLCDLKRGARSCVFADGVARARVMIVGEGPGADEDRQGKPFVGRAGQLLDQMFAAIGLQRDTPDVQRALYITNTVPWRPPGNREPTAEELEMLTPFLLRHIELAEPEVLVVMGNVACDALLGRRGITRLRGTWAKAQGLPVLPMLHPAYLLRNPEAKREAWADLLALRQHLESKT